MFYWLTNILYKSFALINTIKTGKHGKGSIIKQH